mgnify:CR=1 FL=1
MITLTILGTFVLVLLATTFVGCILNVSNEGISSLFWFSLLFVLAFEYEKGCFDKTPVEPCTPTTTEVSQ